MDIDWSSAPEGATHWERECRGESAGWMRKDGGEWFFLSSEGCWIKYFINYVSAERLQNMVPRPDSSPAWTGEGLPPVGAYIEWLSGQYGWLGGRVVGHDGAVTVVSHNDGYTGCHPHEVRPLRTPEQIAAEERAEAVAVMLGLFGETDSRDTYLMQRLYDAGYRKQEIN